MRRKTAVRAVLLLAVLAGGGTFAFKHGFGAKTSATLPSAPAPAPIVAGTVEQHDVPIYLTGVGTVIAYNTDVVRSQIQGQIMQIAFSEGQSVHVGDLLAQIDPRPYQAQLDQFTANRYRDQALGEIRRPLFVTRDVDIAIAPDELLWPVDGGAREPRHFTVTVTNRARGPANTRVAVTVPAGWPTISPESLAFAREDESKSVLVSVAPPATDSLKPGTYSLRAGGGGGSLEIIDYPHIRPRAITKASVSQIRLAPIALPALSHVGYVRGAADRVPEALLGIGVPLELIGPDSLARGDLSRYDAIVIGSRAYETEPALVANNGRLLDYARNGGLLVVQYQQYPFIDGGFAPYPLTMARPHDRVTDENAPVTELDPSHAVFHYPNQIGTEDWRGWVQERGLYFAHSWDTTYVPVLETHDPSPPNPPGELKGGLLIAPVGRGTYVYTGLSFFRQLPAGVPGAYRLFVNLLGLKRRNVP